jgi:hypothetical protein
MMSEIPDYEIMKRMVEEKLSLRLNGMSRVKLVKKFDEKTLNIIYNIDYRKFREELQYTKNEIAERMKKRGFLCFLIYLDDKAIAFEYGYDVADGIYFSDSQATLVEGKGVGSTQFALEILYLFKKGYKKVILTTEEFDDQGRALQNFWERMGFMKIDKSEDGNVEMELNLNKDSAKYLYQRYIQPHK